MSEAGRNRVGEETKLKAQLEVKDRAQLMTARAANPSAAPRSSASPRSARPRRSGRPSGPAGRGRPGVKRLGSLDRALGSGFVVRPVSDAALYDAVDTSFRTAAAAVVERPTSGASASPRCCREVRRRRPPARRSKDCSAAGRRVRVPQLGRASLSQPKRQAARQETAPGSCALAGGSPAPPRLSQMRRASASTATRPAARAARRAGRVHSRCARG